LIGYKAGVVLPLVCGESFEKFFGGGGGGK